MYSVRVNTNDVKEIERLLKLGYGIASVAYMVGVPKHIVWGVQIGEIG